MRERRENERMDVRWQPALQMTNESSARASSRPISLFALLASGHYDYATSLQAHRGYAKVQAGKGVKVAEKARES